jgi:hypothetical protein
VAVVRLRKDHYAHKSYGKIYTPVFEVIEWVSMDGEAEAPAPAPKTENEKHQKWDDEEAEARAEVAPALAGRRRRSA